MMDGKALGQQILDAVKGYVARAKDELSGRLDQVEERIKAIPAGKDGKDGKDGVDGKDGRNAFEIAVSLGYEGTVHEWLESLQGKNGKDGFNGAEGVTGRSAYDDAVLMGFKGTLGEWLESLRRAGADGKDGVDGKSVTLDEVRPLVEEAFKAVPVPKDGKDGRDGRDGVDGKNGMDGKSVLVEDFLPIFEAAVAKSLLDIERRATDLIQRCIDRIEKPKDGKNGRDAFELGDIQLSLGDDERTLTLAFVRGDERVERSIVLTHPIYHGVWREGEFVKGDSVTYGGSTWVATRKTSSKPEVDDSWRLAVKRGRDGKDGIVKTVRSAPLRV